MANDNHLDLIAIKQLMDSGLFSSFDVKQFIADEANTPRVPAVKTVESSALPTDRLLTVSVGVVNELGPTPHQIKTKLVTELAEGMYSTNRVDLEVVEHRASHRTDYRMSAYVFTREQMIAFIRDVEDAVKEQLAQ